MTVVIVEGSRRERKRREIRERLLEAALDLFTKNGFDRTTIDDVAFAADVGKGTVYNYYRTKEDIVVAFFLDIEREVQEQLNGLAHDRRSLQAVLTGVIQLQFKLKEPHHAFVRVFLAQLCAKATAQTHWVHEIQTIIDPPLVRLFTKLQGRGVLRPDIPTDTLVQAFKIMHLGLTVLWAIEGPPWSSMPKIVNDQVRLFCSGIEVKQ
jgi:AcrR family transcriptional regulator